ncbi:Uma2 family endonuclease [Parasediminibacterium sp. JCM 36343]|uniref:Uma2 family endonuclease n=1 Tax=Parasediminibacterium sp. JCM 36343 TaxID=3374279 RepID=UPI00397A2584
MANDSLLAALVDSPNAIKIIEAATLVFAKEREDRAKFYDLVHENHKAEFINGQIVFHSPVRLRHWDASMKLSSLLHVHVDKNQLGIVGVEKVMIQLTRNDYEPDICFFKKERADTFAPEQLLFPAPDFIIEIVSESTEKNDRGIKLIDYAAHGVTEYWIVDTKKKSIEQYLLQGNEYMLEAKITGQGYIESAVVTGFGAKLEDIF